jgi:hypothetical protein
VSTIIRKDRDIDIGHEIHAVLGDLVYRETTYGNKKNDHPLNLTGHRVSFHRDIEESPTADGAPLVEPSSPNPAYLFNVRSIDVAPTSP